MSRTDSARVEAARRAAFDQAIDKGLTGMVGFGVLEHRDERARLIDAVPFANLITDAGDAYYAGKMIVGIAPAAPAAPTPVSGMKLGTGTTAVAKAGAGGALVTYLAGSNVAFDATYPQNVNLGAGLGNNAVYKTTFGAGVATSAALTEAVIVTDAGTNATSALAATIARLVFSAINKGASDTLAITWNHKQLGA